MKFNRKIYFLSIILVVLWNLKEFVNSTTDKKKLKSLLKFV